MKIDVSLFFPCDLFFTLVLFRRNGGITHMDLRTRILARTTIRSIAGTLSTAALLFSGIGFSGCKENSVGSTDQEMAAGVAAAALIDHRTTTLSEIPESYIRKAKRELRIAYGHTSHGSQIITGMTGLVPFKGSLYSFNNTGADSALTLHDTPFGSAADLGNPDRTAWAAATRSYLLAHPEVNVVIWSWCGQVSTATPADIDTYLALMDSLERAFPAVSFVYMTGHLDGTGLEGNLHKRNQQIRSYCATHNKRLFDFADIETWTPDGLYMGDKKPNDNCDYDSNGDGTLDRNWATEWQNTHPDQWYQCSSAHSQPLNANRKAYAAWWLWARLAGWNGISN